MNYIPKWVTSTIDFDDSESDTDEPNNFEKTVVATKITIKEEKIMMMMKRKNAVRISNS
jgi:hypothetical protein